MMPKATYLRYAQENLRTGKVRLVATMTVGGIQVLVRADMVTAAWGADLLGPTDQLGVPLVPAVGEMEMGDGHSNPRCLSTEQRKAKIPIPLMSTVRMTLLPTAANPLPHPRNDLRMRTMFPSLDRSLQP